MSLILAYMDSIISKKYEETREKLRNLIRKGLNPLEAKAENHACYFCIKHIEGKMFILRIEGGKNLSEFYVDEICYSRAKLFMNYTGTSVSLN